MCEIAILVFLCKTLGDMVRSRGRNPVLLQTIFAVGWFPCEIIGAVLVIGLSGEQNQNNMAGPGIAGAFLGAVSWTAAIFLATSLMRPAPKRKLTAAELPAFLRDSACETSTRLPTPPAPIIIPQGAQIIAVVTSIPPSHMVVGGLRAPHLEYPVYPAVAPAFGLPSPSLPVPPYPVPPYPSPLPWSAGIYPPLPAESEMAIPHAPPPVKATPLTPDTTFPSRHEERALSAPVRVASSQAIDVPSEKPISEMVDFPCEHCGHMLRAPAVHLDKRGRCLKCREFTTVRRG
jgi:hypothetical protein